MGAALPGAVGVAAGVEKVRMPRLPPPRTRASAISTATKVITVAMTPKSKSRREIRIGILCSVCREIAVAMEYGAIPFC
jgi:hypothetical protein